MASPQIDVRRVRVLPQLQEPIDAYVVCAPPRAVRCSPLPDSRRSASDDEIVIPCSRSRTAGRSIFEHPLSISDKD
ncbi:hypothetical protein [Burkholderia territorii]|uniref:hypothetical protein n=1 Tax=Burkholderia territorii TaxID=1503055 RepID=UPI000AF6D07A|nr:hypothetical protein [Burkholderia territorii]